MDQEQAELEAGEANEKIRKKISQLKEIKSSKMSFYFNALVNCSEFVYFSVKEIHSYININF